MSAQLSPRFGFLPHDPLQHLAPAPRLPSPGHLLAVAEALPGASAVLLDPRFTVLGGTDRWFQERGLRRGEAVGSYLITLVPTPQMEERITLCMQGRASSEALVMRGIREGVHEITMCMPALEGAQPRLVWIEQLAAGAPLGDAQERTLYPVTHTWGALSVLTMKQLDVVRLVGMGLENERIAAIQAVSRRTTEWHMRSIYEAMAVEGRAELARLSMRAGLPSFPLDAWERILRGRDRDRAREAIARARDARRAPLPDEPAAE